MKELYRYIWKVSARDQVRLSLLAVALFLIELAPLELQRRIVNGAERNREQLFSHAETYFSDRRMDGSRRSAAHGGWHNPL